LNEWERTKRQKTSQQEKALSKKGSGGSQTKGGPKNEDKNAADKHK